MRSNAGSDATAELLIYKYTQLNTIRTFSFWITGTNHIGCRADLPFTLKKKNTFKDISLEKSLEKNSYVQHVNEIGV